MFVCDLLVISVNCRGQPGDKCHRGDSKPCLPAIRDGYEMLVSEPHEVKVRGTKSVFFQFILQGLDE